MESIIFALNKEDITKVKELSDMIPDINVGIVKREKFSDGELSISYDTSVRGKRVYIVGTLNNSDNIILMNFAIDAAKRGSAIEIIPVIPYFPYARQDKKDYVRGPIGAKVMASTFEMLGATNMIVFDLHADQIQGFFSIPITHMEGKHLFGDTLRKEISEKGYANFSNVVLCSPDAGGTKRVKHFRDKLNNLLDTNLSYVMIDKTRAKANVVEEMIVIGDVKGKDVYIIDDMCDTAGTLCKAATLLKKMGALSVTAVVTHGIFSGMALSRIGKNPDLSQVLTSDSLPQLSELIKRDDWVATNPEKLASHKIKVISNKYQIVKAIKAINGNISVEKLKIE